MTVKRYGMAHHTIRYWQDSARLVGGHFGIAPYAARLIHQINHGSAQQIGHTIIALAACHAGPDYIRTVLQTGRLPR